MERYNYRKELREGMCTLYMHLGTVRRYRYMSPVKMETFDEFPFSFGVHQINTGIDMCECEDRSNKK